MGLRGHPDMGQLANCGGGKIAGKCYWQGQNVASNPLRRVNQGISSERHSEKAIRIAVA